MIGLPPDLKKELNQVLLACGPFASNAELRHLFRDERLAPWRHQIPGRDTALGRVEMLVDFLLEKTHERYGNALLAFLDVLQRRLDPEDRCFGQLADLTARIASRLTQSPSPTPGRAQPISARYQRQGKLGQGTFAVVYKAWDATLNRPVALKVLRPHWQDDPKFVARFQREAQTAAGLRHRNIVHIYDHGQDEDGRLFIAMEYLPGRALDAYLEEHGVLTPAQALPLLAQIAAALDYAHGRGVVHRDLKPGNVMVEETADGPVAVLTDFGLARALEESVALTMHASALGSPAYMAPEQADPERVDDVGPAADRYALGILAYKLLTGRVPFRGRLATILYAHEHKAPPAPRTLRPDLPEPVEAAVLQMLAKAPGDRFARCADFVAALAPSPAGPEERLAATYAEMLEAVAEEDWFEVLLLGGQIRGVRRGYRDVAGHIKRARVALARPGPRPKTPPKTKPAPGRATEPDDADVWVNPITGKEMVRVPAGAFLFGEEKEERELPEFWIDKTPVTNAEYARFVAAKDYDPPRHWKGKELPPELADHPVVWVSWSDAGAYAEWARGELPSEEQWEKAARGTDGRVYPWGDEWEEGRCNTKEAGVGETTAVGKYVPVGDSPYGCVDMSGNVWEWTSTEGKYGHILKGGSYWSDKGAARAAARSVVVDDWYDNCGLRVVMSAAPFSTSDL